MQQQQQQQQQPVTPIPAAVIFTFKFHCLSPNCHSVSRSGTVVSISKLLPLLPCQKEEDQLGKQRGATMALKKRTWNNKGTNMIELVTVTMRRMTMSVRRLTDMTAPLQAPQPYTELQTPEPPGKSDEPGFLSSQHPVIQSHQINLMNSCGTYSLCSLLNWDTDPHKNPCPHNSLVTPVTYWNPIIMVLWSCTRPLRGPTPLLGLPGGY